MAPGDQEPFTDAVGLPVAPGLVRDVVSPARPGRANPFLVALVAAGSLALIAAVVGGILWLYSAQVREAAQERAALAFGAVLAADSVTLRDVVPAAAAAAVPQAVWSRAAKRSRDVSFGEATWDATTVTIPYTFAGKAGSMALTPDPAAPGDMLLKTAGAPFGSRSGRIDMVREWDGWKAAVITVGSETFRLDAAGIRDVLGQ